MNKKIIHIIDSLGVGGAEQLLVGVINFLPDYHHTIIFLRGENAYSEQLKKVEVINLGYKNRLSTITAIVKLRKLFERVNPSIIHAHLPTSSYLVRLANFKKAKVFFTVHNLLSKSLLPESKLTWYLEKILAKKSHHSIFVSKTIKEDYERHIGIKGEWSILYNYVRDEFIPLNDESKKIVLNKSPLRFISVGSLKKQKNHQFLIECFSKLDPHDFELDIVGSGPEKEWLKSKIEKLSISNVKLIGRKTNLHLEFDTYDFFILASNYEGFGIAPIEAMAMGVPLILSELNVFKEIVGSYALFFDATDDTSLLKLIHSLKDNFRRINKNINNGIIRVKENFTEAVYIENLVKIYKS